MCICVYVCIYIYMYTCTYTHMSYVYIIHMHTLNFTYIPLCTCNGRNKQTGPFGALVCSRRRGSTSDEHGILTFCPSALRAGTHEQQPQRVSALPRPRLFIFDTAHLSIISMSRPRLPHSTQRASASLASAGQCTQTSQKASPKIQYPRITNIARILKMLQLLAAE